MLQAATGGGVGVGVGVAQIHELSVVQLGFLQALFAQLMVAGQSLSLRHVVPHCGTGVGVGVTVGVGVGVTVGVGVGVAVAQIQSTSLVQLGFRQTPDEQVIPVPQLAVVVHALPHAGTGVGVGVGEAATVNCRVHEV